MTKFKLDDLYTIICDSKPTRAGFKHTAVVFLGNNSICEVKCCYLNRTWEKFCYQTVICKAIEKCIPNKDKYLDIVRMWKYA